jgi:hypothetical protein
MSDLNFGSRRDYAVAWSLCSHFRQCHTGACLREAEAPAAAERGFASAKAGKPVSSF